MTPGQYAYTSQAIIKLAECLRLLDIQTMVEETVNTLNQLPANTPPNLREAARHQLAVLNAARDLQEARESARGDSQSPTAKANEVTAKGFLDYLMG